MLTGYGNAGYAIFVAVYAGLEVRCNSFFTYFCKNKDSLNIVSIISQWTFVNHVGKGEGALKDKEFLRWVPALHYWLYIWFIDKVFSNWTYFCSSVKTWLFVESNYCLLFFYVRYASVSCIVQAWRGF